MYIDSTDSKLCHTHFLHRLHVASTLRLTFLILHRPDLTPIIGSIPKPRYHAHHFLKAEGTGKVCQSDAARREDLGHGNQLPLQNSFKCLEKEGRIKGGKGERQQ